VAQLISNPCGLRSALVPAGEASVGVNPEPLMPQDYVEAILLMVRRRPFARGERWLADRGFTVASMRAGLLSRAA
jgi:hypothetical protein